MKKNSLLAALLLLSMQSWAGTATGTINVTGTVAGTCTVSTTTLNFGTIPAASLNGATATTTLSVTCDSGLPWSIKPDSDANAAKWTLESGAGINVASGGTVSLTLFTPNGTTPWTMSAPYFSTGTGAAQNITVSGKLTPTGSYTGVLSATLSPTATF
ncbi:MAG: spore coat protein U domain-containing protein [Sulfurimicrobium sp.]|nr:spore coat protein U domain-containing protein [Sulfurimicrobium sp.]MDP2199945.1 spore coat protein U domain-containing protein [Sulfurimicrobium sp.]